MKAKVVNTRDLGNGVQLVQLKLDGEMMFKLQDSFYNEIDLSLEHLKVISNETIQIIRRS